MLGRQAPLRHEFVATKAGEFHPDWLPAQTMERERLPDFAGGDSDQNVSFVGEIDGAIFDGCKLVHSLTYSWVR